MATFDQLSAEQRAIIELVLKQGRSYDQLAKMLGMPRSRVRQLARDSLVKLSPVSAAGVDDEWRGQIADYLLQQQSGRESTATRGHLRRSENARAWSRSVLDSLDQFYDPANLPSIPDGDGGGPSRQPWGSALREATVTKETPIADTDGVEKERPRAAKPDLRQRGILVGAGLAVVALLVVIAITVIGGDDDKGDKSRPAARRPAAKVVGQLLLQPVAGARGTGVAVIATRGKERQLIVQARLPANPNGQAYEVWLYNSRRDVRSLGAQVTDRQGAFQGAGPLPRDFDRYKFIDVSRERVDRNTRHSGTSVLRGAIDQFQAPPPRAAQGGGGTTTQP